MLKQYLDNNKVDCSISTYGFGYYLNSKLLDEIAHEGKGAYNFIPDSGLIGTIFINSISNMLSTYANNVILNLEPLNGAKIAHFNNKIEGYKSQGTTWGSKVMVGSV